MVCGVKKKEYLFTKIPFQGDFFCLNGVIYSKI